MLQKIIANILFDKKISLKKFDNKAKYYFLQRITSLTFHGHKSSVQTEVL